MIIQGSNAPIVISLENGTTVADIKDLSIALCWHNANARHSTDKVIKIWGLSDVTLNSSSNTITCPLTQEDTIDYDPGTITIEIKWMDQNGLVHIPEIGTTTIEARCNETILGGE